MVNDPLGMVGQTVADKYRVDACVGEGGFAIVYRAEHLLWKRPVALKLFFALSSAPIAQREALHEAFIKEGALLSELSAHTASIVQARDVGELTTPGGEWMPFMVLEWLEGHPFDELMEIEKGMRRPSWTLQELTGSISQVARALEVAHRQGIAHRDIKPSNFFVLGDNARSNEVVIKLLDFGVAKIVAEGPDARASQARTGAHVQSFTPLYGAPEQFNRSHGATGPWTDVYALALVCVELLAGEPALEGDDVVQLAVATANPRSARPREPAAPR